MGASGSCEPGLCGPGSTVPVTMVSRRRTMFFAVECARGVHPIERRFQLSNKAQQTATPKMPMAPPNELVPDVTKNLQKWKQWISQTALQRLQNAELLVTGDEEESVKGSTSHRQGSMLRKRACEVLIGPDGYHPTDNRVLHAGYTLETERRTSKNPTSNNIAAKRWGFSADALRLAAESIGWPNLELLAFLKYGFYDYSASTLPVSSFPPQQRKATEMGREFRATVQSEITNGRIGEATCGPPSIPFHVVPGSLEPKKESGAWRFVWNASWPSQKFRTVRYPSTAPSKQRSAQTKTGSFPILYALSRNTSRPTAKSSRSWRTLPNISGFRCLQRHFTSKNGFGSGRCATVNCGHMWSSHSANADRTFGCKWDAHPLRSASPCSYRKLLSELHSQKWGIDQSDSAEDAMAHERLPRGCVSGKKSFRRNHGKAVRS